jgi:hypothetical protein
VPKLLDSHAHYCFHSPRCNVHTFPDLYRCDSKECPVSIHIDMAKQAGLVDEKGNVACPQCGRATTLKPGETKAEIHAKLCTDPTIHYPELHKAGKLDAATYTAWKSTLTRDELMGRYKRVPDIHVMGSFTHEETALMTTDLPAFNAIVQTRLRERAEMALLHQVPYRHSTTTPTISL